MRMGIRAKQYETKKKQNDFIRASKTIKAISKQHLDTTSAKSFELCKIKIRPYSHSFYSISRWIQDYIDQSIRLCIPHKTRRKHQPPPWWNIIAHCKRLAFVCISFGQVDWQSPQSWHLLQFVITMYIIFGCSVMPFTCDGKATAKRICWDGLFSNQAFGLKRQGFIFLSARLPSSGTRAISDEQWRVK